MSTVNLFLVILAVLLGLFWLLSLGLVIPPRRYKKHPEPSKISEKRPFRADLPEPVRKHFERTIGDPAPVLHSAVIWGGARARIRGIWLPLRFKAWFLPGEAFFRRFEITWFRQPVLSGKDYFLHNHGAFIFGGDEERGTNIDQSENLMLWAGSVWIPSVFVHDARIRWEAVDGNAARLVLPFGAETDSLTAHFDAITGKMTDLEGLRFRALDPGFDEMETPTKEPWRVDLLEWSTFDGMQIPSQVAFAWGESGSPWSYWWVEGAAYNVDVSERLGEPAPR